MKTTVQIKQRYLVSIPEPIREAFDLKEGDFIEVEITPVQRDIYWRQKEN